MNIFDSEMSYRVAKHALLILLGLRLLNKEQAVIVQMQLLEKYDPTFRSIEEIGDIDEAD